MKTSSGIAKQFLVALVLLTFVSQVLASVSSSCLSGAGKAQDSVMNSAMMGSAVMDHAQPMSMDYSVANMAADCCPDCDCNWGGCGSAAIAVSNTPAVFNLLALTPHINEHAATALPVSLFRPPISR